MEFQQKSAHEDMSRKQHEMQREQAEMQQKMAVDMAAFQHQGMPQPVAAPELPAMHMNAPSYCPAPVMQQQPSYMPMPTTANVQQPSYVPPVTTYGAPAAPYGAMHMTYAAPTTTIR